MSTPIYDLTVRQIAWRRLTRTAARDSAAVAVLIPQRRPLHPAARPIRLPR